MAISRDPNDELPPAASQLERELRDAGFRGRIDVLDDRMGQPVDRADVGRCWYFNVRADVGGSSDPDA